MIFRTQLFDSRDLDNVGIRYNFSKVSKVFEKSFFEKKFQKRIKNLDFFFSISRRADRDLKPPEPFSKSVSDYLFPFLNGVFQVYGKKTRVADIFHSDSPLTPQKGPFGSIKLTFFPPILIIRLLFGTVNFVVEGLET